MISSMFLKSTMCLGPETCICTHFLTSNSTLTVQESSINQENTDTLVIEFSKLKVAAYPYKSMDYTFLLCFSDYFYANNQQSFGGTGVFDYKIEQCSTKSEIIFFNVFAMIYFKSC